MRVRQGAVLVAGAVIFEALLGPGPLAFHFTPLVLGLVYLAVALVGGRGGGHWSTAVVLVGFGLAVAWVVELSPPVGDAPAYLLGTGLGALVGAGLERAGFGVDLVGVAATIALIGGLYALQPQAPALITSAAPYAFLLAVVGVVNLALAAQGRRGSPA